MATMMDAALEQDIVVIGFPSRPYKICLPVLSVLIWHDGTDRTAAAWLLRPARPRAHSFVTRTYAYDGIKCLFGLNLLESFRLLSQIHHSDTLLWRLQFSATGTTLIVSTSSRM